jgi:hypothetical protein
VCNRRKSLLIIDTVFLSKSLGNQARIVSFDGSISPSLDLIDLFITDCKLARRQSGHVPSMSFMKSIKFIDYSLLPKRISASLTIGMRLMESSKCKVTMKISKLRRRNPYPMGTKKVIYGRL